MKAKGKDLLSDLPDDILHHIFSFLGDNNVVRLQALSRRFQNICFTSPSLCLSSARDPHNCSCKPISNFTNSLLQHRPRALKIERLSFSSSCFEPRHRKLHKRWIHKLSQAFLVDELSVIDRLPSVLKILPRFQSLKVLKLHMIRPVSVKLPEVKLASLETLHMSRMITNDPMGEWVSESFPFLKHLLLDRIFLESDFRETNRQGITIRSSCLEDLDISYCCPYRTVRVITDNLRGFSYTICPFGYICGHRVYDYEHSLEICAPILETLTIAGFPQKLHCEGTFNNLNLAALTTGRRLHYSRNLSTFMQLNEALRWATTLHVDVRVLEGLHIIREAPISFGNVVHLRVQMLKLYSDDYDTGEVVITFLERVPNLKSLTLVNDSPGNSKEAHRFDKNIGRDCRLDGWREIKGLKKVEFIIREMDEQVAFLIGMLKEWCVDLKEMILNYPHCHHESILPYLKSFEMAFNYAPLSINFLPDH